MPQIEALLKNLIDLYPQEAELRRILARLYARQNRLDDAEAQLRAIAGAAPSNAQAALAVVQFLNLLRGPDAARQELLKRIEAGGAVFPYQIALADLHAAQGKVDDSVLLLQDLVANAREPEQVLTAQAKLAALYIATKKLEAAEALVADMLRKDSRNIDGAEAARPHPSRARPNRPRHRRPAPGASMTSRATPISCCCSPRHTSAADRSNWQTNNTPRRFAPPTSDAGIGLAYVGFLQRRGNAARAADVLSDLAARWPNNVQVLSALASVKLSNRDWAGAEEIANAVRRLGNRTSPIKSSARP